MQLNPCSQRKSVTLINTEMNCNQNVSVEDEDHLSALHTLKIVILSVWHFVSCHLKAIETADRYNFATATWLWVARALLVLFTQIIWIQVALVVDCRVFNQWRIVWRFCAFSSSLHVAHTRSTGNSITFVLCLW